MTATQVPQEVLDNLLEWKSKHGKIILVDNEAEGQTYVLRPLVAKEYEILLEADSNDSLSYLYKSILRNCILYPFTTIDRITDRTLNLLLTQLRANSGFDNERHLETLTVSERGSYAPAAPGSQLKHFKAALMVHGNVSKQEVDGLTFDEIIKRIVQVEVATNKALILLPGYDRLGRKMQAPNTRRKP